jgi:streptogramin lyase
MAADSSGNIYFGDGDNLLIRKLNIATGKVEIINNADSIISELQNKADFQGPWSVAVDSGGTMWVVDNVNDQVQQITSEGEVTTLAVAEDDVDAKLLLYDADKEKLLATYDTQSNEISKNDKISLPTMSPKTLQSKLKNTQEKLSPLMQKQPFNKSKLKLKINDDVNTKDSLTPNISPHTSSNSPLTPSKYGMTVDINGNIYLANKNNQNILKFCP